MKEYSFIDDFGKWGSNLVSTIFSMSKPVMKNVHTSNIYDTQKQQTPKNPFGDIFDILACTIFFNTRAVEDVNIDDASEPPNP